MIYYHKVKPYALVNENQRFASALLNRRLADYTNITLEIVIGLLLIAPIPILIYYYPLLPDRIPVHWDIRGIANGWKQKSFGAVFMLPIMMLYIQGLLLIVKHGLMQTKMTLPTEHTAEYLKLKEEFLSATMKMMDWVRMLSVLMMSLLSLGVVITTIGNPSMMFQVTIIIMGITAVMMVVCGYFTYRLVVITTKLKQTTGRSYVQRQTDADHWYWGGVFYFNPEDPALWVEKLVGFGYTINLGNKRALLYVGYMALLPILIRVIMKS